MNAPQGRLQWLSRVGRFCARHGGAIIFAWIVAFALGRGGAGGLPQLLVRGASDIPGSESLRVETLQRTAFASAPADVLLFALRSPSLDRDPQALAYLFRLLQARWEDSGLVAYVVPETQFNDKRMVPPAGTGHIAILGLKAANVHEAGNATPGVRAAVEPMLRTARSWNPDLVWATTGHSALSYDLNRFNSEDTTRAELRALPLVLLILVFAFGSLVAAGMPLVLGLVSITVAISLVYLVAHAALLSDIVQNVASMIGLSVGIDYSLFIIHRYRQELRRIETDHPAVVPADLRRMALEEAMGTAGSAVFFSGLTVLIGLGGLLFTPVVDLHSLGIGGGLGVTVALLASLTFLPALLSLLGPALEWPAIVSQHLQGERSRQRWRTWADVVMRFPVAAASISLAVLLLLAWPGRHTRFGLPEGSFFPAKLEFARGLELLRSMKLKGMLSPLHIVLTDSAGGHALTTERVPALLEFSARLRSDPRVAMIQGPVDLAADWPASRYEALYADVNAAWVLLPFARDSYISRDQTRILLHVLPQPDSTLQDTKALAREIPAWMQIPGLRVELGGQPAYYNDFDIALKAAYGRSIGFVLLVTFVVLLLVFRAPLVALKALLLNGLSVLAGYGMVVYVFQMGHGSGWLGVSAATEIVPLTVPLSMFCLLFGLSMDYEVFLLSRVREAFLRTGDNAASLREGLADTGAVITHAAVIMVAVFGAFAFGRVVLVQMLGFGLAVAVLVDATVIRILLGPALMRLAGRWNWWPAGRTGGPDLAPGRAVGTSSLGDRGAAISAQPTKSRMRLVPLVAALAVLVLGVLAYSFWLRTGQTPGKEAWMPPEFVFADTKAKAERGDADAQTKLGQMYAKGDEGMPKDSVEAVKWYRKAADQGNAKAQGLLGLMYANGEGVPKDSVEAVKWYRKAADQGNSAAQFSLGAMYANGDGVPKDGAEAENWVRKAAHQGNSWAQDLLDLAHFNSDGAPKDEAEALGWCYIAAASGDETAVKARDAIERLLGRRTSLQAQPGSKEILNDIDPDKTRKAVSTAVGSSPPGSSGSGAIVSAHGPEEGQAWTVPELNLGMVFIRPGMFTMGSENGESDEKPLTAVTITQPFWLGKTETTQGQWQALMGNNPSDFKGMDRPVEQVSWSDAMEFCRKLTERERSAGRLPDAYEYTLPTEAQWESACRAGTTGDYAGDLHVMGWYVQNSENQTHPVGQKQANAWGLYDMRGNVWEWCWDQYGDYPGGSVTDPTGPSSGSARVFRGGSCFDFDVRCRSAFRLSRGPDFRSFNLGFRLALAPSLTK